MDHEIKPEKYRELSIAALVTGILGLSPIALYNFLWMPISIFLSKYLEPNVMPNIYFLLLLLPWICQ
jgi:hypothetical protein